MAIIGSVFIGAAAVIHLLIFGMESIGWLSPTVWRRFGVANQQDADTIRPMAYNQGFYNLFLSGGAVVGLLLHWTTLPAVGFGLIFFSGLCMLLASIVLLTTGRKYLRPALLQGLAPLIGLIFFAIS